jgi:hypothetical protein
MSFDFYPKNITASQEQNHEQNWKSLQACSAKFKRMIGGTQDTYDKSYTAEDEALALVILE